MGRYMLDVPGKPCAARYSFGEIILRRIATLDVALSGALRQRSGWERAN